jgi:hypothetical protein
VELKKPEEPEEDPGWDEWPPDGNNRPLPSHKDRPLRHGTERTRCASSDVRGDSGRCVSSGVRQSGDPGGGPEPEADYKPAHGGLLGVLDEIQVLEGLTEAPMPEPAVMRAREMPGEQTTVATATAVGERVQKTARLSNLHGSPSITWEGGEDDSTLRDVRKQSAAQRVPAQLRSSFQPEPRHEATCTEHPQETCLGEGEWHSHHQDPRKHRA